MLADNDNAPMPPIAALSKRLVDLIVSSPISPIV
jgi:hypothetical protein